MSDVGSARRAKDQLKAAIAAEPWCAGIGVEREDGVGFVVRVRVRPGSGPQRAGLIPERIGDVVIYVEENDA
ncbi:MAG: hypothetical protein ABJE95_10295 [Byssovorax sp.]